MARSSPDAEHHLLQVESNLTLMHLDVTTGKGGAFRGFGGQLLAVDDVETAQSYACLLGIRRAKEVL